MVSVRVHTPGFNEILLTHDATGAFVARVDPGSNKVTDLMVPDCGAVTVIDRTGAFYETSTSLADGDELYSFGGFTFVPPKQVSVVIDTPLANVVGYLADAGGCSGQGASPITIDYEPQCVEPDGRGTILVMPNNGTPPEPSFAVFEDVAFAAGPLHVTTWQTNPAIHQVTFNLDAPPSELKCFASSIAKLRVHTGAEQFGVISGNSVTASLQYPEFGDGHFLFCTAIDGDNQLSYREFGAGLLPASVTKDITDLTPLVTGATIDQDAARPTVSYTTTPGAEEDLGMVELTSTVFSLGWRVIVPPNTRTVRLPEVPPDLALDFAGPPRVGVQLFDASDLAGYRPAIHDIQVFIPGLPFQPLSRTIRGTKWVQPQ